MPIDISQEALIPFTQAAAHLPRRRRGRKAAVSTLHRWATRGLRGVVLETLQVGGTKCTSLAALQRFFDRLSVPRPELPVGRSETRKRQRDDSYRQAERDCE